MTTAQPSRSNPYVGPRAFITGEVIYGRENEARDLFYVLTADRIVLLHSPSGAGKTSLIQAALIPRLLDRGFNVLPIIRVSTEVPVIDNQQQSSSLSRSPNRYVLSAMISLDESLAEDQQTPIEHLAHMTFEQYLAHRSGSEPDTDIEVLIFDQFEEILTIDPDHQEEKTVFFQQIGDALLNRQRWALFSMREEYIASLEPYLRWIPTHFKNTFRLELLTTGSALQAIQQPAFHVGVDFINAAADRLVNDLRQVKIQRTDGTLDEQPGLYIEPVQLQVVCRQIWERIPAEASQITVDDIEQIGDVDNALASYYTACVTHVVNETDIYERVLRNWIEYRLITEQGLRGQVLREPEITRDVGNRAIQLLIDAHLVRAEPRRGATWFELTHDRLIEPIRQSNAVWREMYLNPLQRQAVIWDRQGRPESLLLRDKDLIEAQAWVTANPNVLTPIEQKFFKEACIRSEERDREVARQQALALAQARAEEQAAVSGKLRRLSNWLVVMTGIAIVAAVVAVFLWQQAYQNAIKAVQQQRIAETAAAEEQWQRATAEAGSMLANRSANERATAQSQAESRLIEVQSLSLTIAAQGVRDQGNVDVALALALASNQLPASSVQTQFTLSELTYEGTRHVFEGHTDSVRAVAFSPDGQTALSGSWDSTLRLWNIVDGQVVQTFTGHEGRVNSVAFSPDGLTALSGSQDRTLRLWDVRTGKEIRSFNGHDAEIRSIAFSPDGQIALSGSIDGTIRLWNVADGTEIQRLSGHRAGVFAVAFSPDGQTIVSGSQDTTVRIWEVATGQEIQQFTGHRNSIFSVAFSLDGQTILSGSADWTVRLWNVATSEEMHRFEGHTGWVVGVAFSPDGQSILSGSLDRTARLWNVDDEESELRRFDGHADGLLSVAFSPDGQSVLSGSHDRTLRRWDIQSGTALNHYDGHTAEVSSVAFSPDGQFAVSGSYDRTVRIWDIQRGQELHRLSGHLSEIFSVAFSPDGNSVLSGSRDRTARIWDIQTEDVVQIFTGHADAVRSVGFAADGNTALSGSWDETIQLWSVQSVQEQQRFIGHDNEVMSIALSPDGQTVLSGSIDGTVRLWDRHTGKEIRRFDRHAAGVQSVAFSPDGQTVLSGSNDRTMQLWNVATGQQVQRFLGHTQTIQSVAFSPDGQTVLSGSDDRTIRLWDITTGQEIQRFFGHRDGVTSVAFSPDGATILSGSKDRTVRLWRIHTIKEMVEWTCKNRYVPQLTPEQMKFYRVEHQPCDNR